MAAAHNDTEELLGGHSRSTIAVKRGRTIAILVAAVMAVVTVAVLTSGHETQPLHIAAFDSVKLNQAYHETEFGSVPHTLHISGFACPDGTNDLNGKYTFQGKTGDGRAFYAQGDVLLYYDRECDGNRGGRDNRFGSWQFVSSLKGHFHPTRKEQFAEDGCSASARLLMDEHPEKYLEEKPYQDFRELPGATPPAVHKWHVYCGDDDGWTDRLVHVRGYVAVQGSWQFVKTAMPKENITLKHGKSRTTTEGGNWQVSGSTSVTLGGEVGVLGFAGGSVEAPTEVGDRLQHIWEAEVESTSEQTVEFQFPESKGSALWQWVLIAKGKETGYVKTEQYAFTASGTGRDRPKCFPGGSKDGYRYQECHDGWEIP